MRRPRLYQRTRTDFPVIAQDGQLRTECRGIEVSSTGIILDRGRPVEDRHNRLYLDIQFRLPGHRRTLHALARPIWTAGSFQALKIIVMSDVDRLSLAEHVDEHCRRGRSVARTAA